MTKSIAGMRYGRLAVIERADSAKSRHAMWRCKCDCGKEVAVLGINLRNGRTTSCGCLRNEKTATRLTKHNGYHSKAYRTWANMLQRCTNKNNKDLRQGKDDVSWPSLK